MRQLLICASLISATGFTPVALAEADYYVKGGLSYSAPAEQDETNANITEWDFENGLGFQGAIGHQYSETLAVELELQYKSFDAQERTESGTTKTGLGGDLTYTSLMLNGYYTPQLESQSDIFNPYLGAGIGLSKVKWDSITVDGFSGEIDDSDTVAAFQLMLGNRFNLSEDAFITTEYRYFRTADYEITSSDGDTGKFDNSNHHSVVISIGTEF